MRMSSVFLRVQYVRQAALRIRPRPRPPRGTRAGDLPVAHAPHGEDSISRSPRDEQLRSQGDAAQASMSSSASLRVTALARGSAKPMKAPVMPAAAATLPRRSAACRAVRPRDVCGQRQREQEQGDAKQATK